MVLLFRGYELRMISIFHTHADSLCMSCILVMPYPAFPALNVYSNIHVLTFRYRPLLKHFDHPFQSITFEKLYINHSVNRFAVTAVWDTK